MERLSAAYRPVHQGYPDFKATCQHTHDLIVLMTEAIDTGNRDVADACGNCIKCLQAGARINADDARLVQGFIGKRTEQDRYGR